MDTTYDMHRSERVDTSSPNPPVDDTTIEGALTTSQEPPSFFANHWIECESAIHQSHMPSDPLRVSVYAKLPQTFVMIFLAAE
jgi:hypothetical protein